MLLNFLQKVLPSEGVKCWTSIRDGKAVNHFCTSFEELAGQIRQNDAAGVDTYHACASYQNGQNRRGGNVALVQAFWIDVDVGEGKPYAKIEDAISASDQFCNRAGLPIPGIVRSGGGIHLYWTLDRPLTPAEWLPVAQRLKLLVKAHGLLSNPSDLAIISDIARILRPPETHNYKIPGHPRPVSIDDIELFEPVSCEEFITACLKAPLGSVPQNINFTERNTNGTLGISGSGTSNIGNGAGIAIEEIRNKAGCNNVFSAGISKAFDATKGVVQGSRGSHRIKYAGELVAKGFSPEEVLAKLLAWDALCQPPEGEAACIHSMKSAFSMHAARHPAPPALMQTLVTERPIPNLPFGYKWGTSGELLRAFHIPDPADKTKRVLDYEAISPWTLFLSAQLNHEGYTDNIGYLFMQWHTLEDCWKEIILSSEEMNGDKWYAYFYKRGGEISANQHSHFKKYVHAASISIRDERKKVMQYNQFGWKNDDTAFLVGEFLCKNDGTFEKAYGTPKMQALMQAMKPTAAGCLQAWSAAANKLFMPGLEPHAFALLCSFASVLMKFVVDQGNGGSIVSLVSEKSGTGKTPATIAAASVWGDLRALVDTGNFTENRLIEDLVRHNNLPVMREEMPYSDPQVAADGVKKFTSGSDRGRLDRTGAPSGIPESYQNILISVSNKSFYDLVAIADIPMSRRIFEVVVPRAEKDELENIGGIAREMMRNYGHAGVAFVRFCLDPNMHKYIEEHLQGVGGRLGHTQAIYRARLNSQPEHRFIVWVITCVDVASRILCHSSMLNFNVERMMAWIVQQASDQIHQVEHVPEDIQSLTSFLSENSDCAIVVQTPYQPGQQAPIIMQAKRRVMMRMEMKPPRLYIANAPFKEWCTRRGVSFIAMGKELAAKKIVTERSKMVTLTAGTSIPGGREGCMEIDMGHPAMTGVARLEDIKSEMIKKGAA